jgi:hypothetical protein
MAHLLEIKIEIAQAKQYLESEHFRCQSVIELSGSEDLRMNPFYKLRNVWSEVSYLMRLAFRCTYPKVSTTAFTYTTLGAII